MTMMMEKYIKFPEVAEHIGYSEITEEKLRARAQVIEITAEKLRERARAIEMGKEDEIPERIRQAVIDLWTEKFRTGAEKLRITACSGGVELQMDITFTVKKDDAKAHAQLLELGKQLFGEKE